VPIEVRHEITAADRKDFPKALFLDSLPISGDFESVKEAATPTLKLAAERVKLGGTVFWPSVSHAATPEIRAWYNRCFMRLLELDVIAESSMVGAQKERKA
jgi:hypothetical protein